MIKYVFIFLLPLYSFSQFVAKNEIDEFTGDKTIQVNCMTGSTWGESDKISKGLFAYAFLTGRYVLSKDSPAGSYSLTLNLHQLAQGSCLSEYDGKAIWLFEDNSTLEITQFSKTDCNWDNLTGYYSLSSDEVDKLINARVKKLRVYTTKGYIDYEIKPKKIEAIQLTFTLLKDTVEKQ